MQMTAMRMMVVVESRMKMTMMIVMMTLSITDALGKRWHFWQPPR